MYFVSYTYSDISFLGLHYDFSWYKDLQPRHRKYEIHIEPVLVWRPVPWVYKSYINLINCIFIDTCIDNVRNLTRWYVDNVDQLEI